MSETTIRIERHQGYTVLQNDMLRDSRLSLKAKGLLAVLLGLPDNWQYTISGLAKVCGTGKDAIRSALREIEAAGYMNREQAHGDSGHFAGNLYVVRDVSTSPSSENPTTVEEIGAPLSGFPSTGNPSTENPTQLNKDILNKDLINTPPTPPRGERGEEPKKKGPTLPEDVKGILRKYVGTDRELAEALGALMEVRLAGKKAVNTPRAIRGLLKELDRLSYGSRPNKLALLRKAAASGWLTVYPMRPGELPEGQPFETFVPSRRVTEEAGTYEL